MYNIQNIRVSWSRTHGFMQYSYKNNMNTSSSSFCHVGRIVFREIEEIIVRT